MFKALSTLVITLAFCAPALADNNEPQPKGKRPAVSFGARDIQSQDTPAAKRPAPAAAPAPAAKPAKKIPTTKTY